MTADTGDTGDGSCVSVPGVSHPPETEAADMFVSAGYVDDCKNEPYNIVVLFQTKI